MRRAFTLIELVFAMALFAVLMSAALQCFGGASRYVDQESSQNDMLLEGRRVMATIVADLGNSAWYIPADADATNGVRSPLGPDLIEFDHLKDPDWDRRLRYYPYVNVQTASGRGIQFPDHDRAAADVPDTGAFPPTLPVDHRDLSQELIFLKVRSGAAAPTPAQVQPTRVNFNDRIRPMSFYRAGRSGVDVGSVIATFSPGPISTAVVTDIPLAWESHLDTPSTATPDDLREYSYVVTPNAATGKGQLERRYRNGGAAMAIDRVISANVDRIVFDTYRTTAGLGVNQVRVVVYLSRELQGQPGMFSRRRVETTVALRSTVDPEYSLNLGGWLGTAGGYDVN